MENSCPTGRRVTCQPELHRASQHFLHFLTKLSESFTWQKKKLVRLSETWRDYQSMCKLSTVDSGKSPGLTFSPYKDWIKLSRLGGWPSLITRPGSFSSYTRGFFGFDASTLKRHSFLFHPQSIKSIFASKKGFKSWKVDALTEAVDI